MMSRQAALLLIALRIGAFAREPQPPAETIRQVAEYRRKPIDFGIFR